MTAGTIPAEHGRECAVAEGTFGPYRLVDCLGAGGMGEVWRAVDTRKSREVALKLIRSDGAAVQGFAARFHREAELAARLSSPYIVPIHDYGQSTVSCSSTWRSSTASTWASCSARSAASTRIGRSGSSARS